MGTLVGLHGFLGGPGDFSELFAQMSSQDTWAPDLYTPGPLDPRHDFTTWSDHFAQALERRWPEKPWLLGYSMGGRLALHMATLKPAFIRGVIVVSAHPGRFDHAEQVERQTWEQKWSQIFLREPLERAVQLWNSQDLFQNSKPLNVRPDLNSQLVSLSLSQWSSTRHQFDLSQLKPSTVPIVWMVGARDLAYRKLLARFEPIRVIEGAGHRVMLDAPKALAVEVDRTMMGLSTQGSVI